MKTYFKLILLVILCNCVLPATQARVALPRFVTDSMVIQQKSAMKINGSAKDYVNIRVSWDKKDKTVKVDESGKFTTTISTPKAGGPYTMTFKDAESSITLHDIYVGEVWLCSGQSNMEMPVGGWGKVQNYQWEIANANYPDIRFLQIKKQISYSPEQDTEVNMGGWRTCTPSTVENFSSIAYFYAREMSKKLGVHVGVIDCSWGGTPAEAWTSFEGVSKVAGFENEIKLIADNNGDAEGMKRGYEENLSRWMQLANTSNIDFDKSKYQSGWGKMPIPCEWENSVLPEFDGIVWMQCKFNVPKDWEGKTLELNLGMIDDEDVTYFNGVQIAKGSGYNVPRHYQVPGNLVKAGEAVITIRVSDFGGGGGLWGSASDVNVKAGDKVIPLAGEWAYNIAVDFSALPMKPVSVESSSYPTTLYNAMLYPLHVMPIKGVLWYQGCANVGRDKQYSQLFRQMITDWRTLWKDKKLPFYFVQLAGFLKPRAVQYDSKWAALREAQADALALPKTSMVTAIDIGNPDDIHPKNKQEVARRLSLVALYDSYGYKNIKAFAPNVENSSFKKDGRVEITFNEYVKSKDSVVNGFIARLADGTWTKAEAKLSENRKIVLTAPQSIVEVRYDWADYPDGNLVGYNGLPVVPFRIEK